MKRFLEGKAVLVTAGPTREYLDPVRYIGNDSSGEMGFALARAAKGLGAKVTVVCGPVVIAPPGGVRCLNVVSACEMFAVVKKYYKKADVIVCAAAVADWRPAKFSACKIKKGLITPAGDIYLKLIKNPDILAWLGRHKNRHQTLIGFALETNNLLKNAREKLREKNCDMIVANMASNIGKKTGSAILLTSDGRSRHIKRASKGSIARHIFMSPIYQNC